MAENQDGLIDFDSWKEDVAAGSEVCAIISLPERQEMTTFDEWREGDEVIVESASHTRYSVEVNYRTSVPEALEAYAKIALGYVSAALKNYNYHVKHIYTEKPIRLLVSSRNWDDGEWVGVVSWNPDHKCFVVSKGFYNKERRAVAIQNSEKCQGETPADVSKHLYNLMHSLKGQPDRYHPKLKAAPLKRGPKQ